MLNFVSWKDSEHSETLRNRIIPKLPILTLAAFSVSSLVHIWLPFGNGLVSKTSEFVLSSFSFRNNFMNAHQREEVAKQNIGIQMNEKFLRTRFPREGADSVDFVNDGHYVWVNKRRRRWPESERQRDLQILLSLWETSVSLSLLNHPPAPNPTFLVTSGSLVSWELSIFLLLKFHLSISVSKSVKQKIMSLRTSDHHQL